MRSIPSAPTLAPWSRTVGRPICWWSRATSRGWSRRSTGSVSRRFPPAHRTVDRGHGRIEQRTTWVAPAPPDLNFPHAAQVVIVQRHTTDLAGKHPHTALIYDSPVIGQIRRLTYRELLDEVARFAGVLQDLGVRKGDTVVIYMPMVPEAVVAMLACARRGAVHSVVCGGFAAHELAIRVDDARPKVVVSASCGIEVSKVVA